MQRFPVMYNDFVIIGPKADPAGIAGGTDTLDALRKIKSAGAPFVSRGDRSGTHIAEVNLWTMAGIDIEKEKGPWYRETGQGMGPALNTASSMNAYLLADRATWLAFRNRGELAILVEGDTAAHQPVRRHARESREAPQRETRRGPGVHRLARVAGRTERRLPTYKIGGEQLFFPNAGDPGA